MSRKKQTIEELLEAALVTEEEQPYVVSKNWIVMKTNTIVDVRDGTHDTPIYQDTGIPLITSKNLKNGKLDFTNVKYISKEAHLEISKRSNVEANDILFAMIGTIGNPVLIEQISQEFSIKNVALFKPNIQNIDCKYLYYYLQSPIYINYLKKNEKGSTQKFVPLNVLRNAPLYFPPLSEQKRIVEKVERLLNKVEEAKQLIEEAKETFELRRASILDKAFRGELTRKWRKENKVVTIANEFLEEINLLKAGAKTKFKDQLDSGILETLYGLPNEWKWVRLNDLIQSSTYGTSAKTNDDASGTPVLRMGNIVDGYILLNSLKYLPNEHEDVLKYDLQTDDLLFNSYELVGKTAVITEELSEKFTFASYLIRVRLFYKDVLATYVSHYINSHIGRKMLLSMVTQQVGQANINSQKLASLPIPLPPKEEVMEITKWLNNYRKLEDEQKEMLHVEKSIEALKQSILSKAFRGELGTNDPSEENAIELLKEILKSK